MKMIKIERKVTKKLKGSNTKKKATEEIEIMKADEQKRQINVKGKRKQIKATNRIQGKKDTE